MSERDLTIIPGGKEPAAQAADGKAPRRTLARSGAEFVARIDLGDAQNRFVAMLADEARESEAVDAAVARYQAFEAAQGEPSTLGLKLERHRSSFDDHLFGGTVLEFDARRGYGFVRPDSGMHDALIRVRLLRSKGLRVFPANARVVCAITETARGPVVTDLHELDLSTAIDPAQIPRIGEPRATVVAGWRLATLQSMNWRRGEGKIRLTDGSEIVIRAATFNRCGIAYADPGHPFDVLVGRTDNGLVIVQVRLPCAEDLP